LQIRNDTIIIEVGEDDSEQLIEVSPAALATCISELETTFSFVASRTGLHLETSLFIVSVRPGSIEFHFHAHYHLPAQDSAAHQGRRDALTDAASLAQIGQVVWPMIVFLLAASCVPAANSKNVQPEETRLEIEIPAKLLQDSMVRHTVDSWARSALKLGARVTVRVPDADPVTIRREYLRGRGVIASQSRNPIPASVGQPLEVFKIGFQPLSQMTVEYEGRRLAAFLGTVSEQDGQTARQVMIVWQWSMPIPQAATGNILVRGQFLDREQVASTDDVPAHFREVDGILLVTDVSTSA